MFFRSHEPVSMSGSTPTWANQITGANSHCAGQSDGCSSRNAVVAGATALPAAVAQFRR